MARSKAVRMQAAGAVDPGDVANCPEQEQELTETFQPTGEMIATYSKRVALSKLTLETYMEVFDLLTKGTGNVVQPNSDAMKISNANIFRVGTLHDITFKRDKNNSSRKEVMLEALVGMELLNPRSFAGQGSVPHVLSEEEMQEDLLALQWQD